jgi:type II secretory pathway component PulM
MCWNLLMCDPKRAALAALWLGLACAAQLSPAAAQDIAARPAPAAASAQAPPEAVTQMADWVIASGDSGDLPFVIIDKVAAKVFVFRGDGQLRGAAPALVGSARGDNSSPGVGDREMSAIPLNERTTPAGRFVASFGSAREKQRVLWVDYATAIALHPVVTANPKERRLQRLKSRTPRDNHITHGCINVSAAFYEKVVRPAFARTSGIVYVLPEKSPMEEVFPTFRPALRDVAASAATGPAGAAKADAALSK